MSLLERLFTPRAKCRIIEILMRAGAMTMTSLTRELGLNYQRAARYVEELRELGVVRILRIGRIKIVMLNERSPIAVKIRELHELANQHVSSRARERQATLSSRSL